jgi:hypothetical protein
MEWFVIVRDVTPGVPAFVLLLFLHRNYFNMRTGCPRSQRRSTLDQFGLGSILSVRKRQAGKPAPQRKEEYIT